MSGSPILKIYISKMRQHLNGDVMTICEPIFRGFMFGCFCVYKKVQQMPPLKLDTVRKGGDILKPSHFEQTIEHQFDSLAKK